MKPGDLRKFKNLDQRVTGWRELEGQSFLVVSAKDESAWVSFLVDGRLEEEWCYRFVEKSSEVISEAR